MRRATEVQVRDSRRLLLSLTSIALKERTDTVRALWFRV
jgi:hypothetical protein